MSKKLILACMSVAAFAAFVVLPATASAGAALCETEGSVCKTPTAPFLVHAVSEGHANFVSGGTTLVTCETATMTGTVIKNGPVVEGNITTADFHNKGTTPCSSSFGGATTVDTNIGNGVPWCLKSVEGKDEWTLRGNSCTLASRSVTFVLTTTNIGTCKYNRTTPLTGTFNTHEEAGGPQATLKASPGESTKFTKEEGSILCPGSGELEMSFTLTTDNPSTFTPLYIETSP